ncbi:MAG: ribonuclease III, partial [Gammaproteobacteria bacterium]|nr:ribonuclease III [Gammaproteobacteria bacterium]
MDYEFNDDSLRVKALTHRSAGSDNNERLEFLGDALLGLITAQYLFEHFPAADEGELTRTRASLVNRDTLAEIARSLDLGNLLVLGEGEQKSGGWRRDSILANSLEALLGAIYLDGGMDVCRQAVETWFAEKLADVDPKSAAKDAKTALQELLQSRRLELPRYETTDISGPSHDQTFTVA